MKVVFKHLTTGAFPILQTLDCLYSISSNATLCAHTSCTFNNSAANTRESEDSISVLQQNDGHLSTSKETSLRTDRTEQTVHDFLIKKRQQTNKQLFSRSYHTQNGV